MRFQGENGVISKLKQMHELGRDERSCTISLVSSPDISALCPYL